MTKIRLLIPILVISVFLASCATAPPEAAPKADDTAVVEDTKPAEKPADKTAMMNAKSQAETARKKATDAKAPRAAKTLFNAAAAQYEAGLKSEGNNDFETATSSYKSAAEGFTKAAEAADKARVEALEAMKAADEAIKSTEKTAEDAVREVSEESAQ